MFHADEVEGAGRTEALLWAAAPAGPLPAPPVDTRAQVLPVGVLQWPDVERLFARLLDMVRPLQFVKLFGFGFYGASRRLSCDREAVGDPLRILSAPGTCSPASLSGEDGRAQSASTAGVLAQ
ncbi:MAG: hypothetical protein QOH97_3020 [Actinoplanes sp.]|jgi:hypothetical protein|nr:hypothetical protein [Actinoplanes sp.]